MALGRPGLVTALHAVAIGIRFGLLVVFIPRWGILGAATALVASSAAHLLLVLACYPIVLRRRPPGLIPRKEDMAELLRFALEYHRAFRGARGTES
jgi:O-antigen/teichoic acid export membrane protein